MRRKMTRRDRSYRDGVIQRHVRRQKRGIVKQHKETEAERRKREAAERQYLIRVVLKPHWLAEEHIFSTRNAEFLPVQGCTCATCERVREWRPVDVVNPLQGQLDRLNGFRRRVREEMAEILNRQTDPVVLIEELEQEGPTEVVPAARSVYWNNYLRELVLQPTGRGLKLIEGGALIDPFEAQDTVTGRTEVVR